MTQEAGGFPLRLSSCKKHAMRFPPPCRSKSRTQTDKCPVPEKFWTATARTTPRRVPTFMALYRVLCQKSTNSFSKENNVDLSEATRAQADAAEKTRSPRRTGNERAGLTAELPLPVLHGFQSRRRAGGARRMRTLQQQVGSAPPRESDTFHPSSPKIATDDRAQD